MKKIHGFYFVFILIIFIILFLFFKTNEKKKWDLLNWIIIELVSKKRKNSIFNNDSMYNTLEHL